MENVTPFQASRDAESLLFERGRDYTIRHLLPDTLHVVKFENGHWCRHLSVSWIKGGQYPHFPEIRSPDQVYVKKRYYPKEWTPILRKSNQRVTRFHKIPQRNHIGCSNFISNSFIKQVFLVRDGMGLLVMSEPTQTSYICPEVASRIDDAYNLLV
ncbi:hypothetical protein TNCV_5081841 [Trichonephila clavipes]|nr:hypothetical protein TNCV_5081841 [Trichonephila clavipes]